jgi:hypothetical protein
MGGRPKGVTIRGVRFRPGEVDWEDAHGVSRDALPDFDAIRNGATGFVGAKITSAGLVGKVGNYLIVITEYDAGDLESTEFDYTLIPLRPKTAVRYH